MYRARQKEKREHRLQQTIIGWVGRKGHRHFVGSSRDTGSCTRWLALAAEFVPELLLPLLFPIIPSNKHLVPLVVNTELSYHTITFTITAPSFVKMAHEIQIGKWNLLSGSFTRSTEEQKVPKGPKGAEKREW
jgi:hypothetical protein